MQQTTIYAGEVAKNRQNVKTQWPEGLLETPLAKKDKAWKW